MFYCMRIPKDFAQQRETAARCVKHVLHPLTIAIRGALLVRSAKKQFLLDDNALAQAVKFLMIFAVTEF